MQVGRKWDEGGGGRVVVVGIVGCVADRACG
jgi:hypothetical protein